MRLEKVIQRLPCGNALLDRVRLWRQATRILRNIGLNRWDRVVIFDVGANNGSSFSSVATAFPWIHVYAFEPTPELLTDLRQRLSRHRNYHIIAKAVGETEGPTTFNVAGSADWGCSSVLEFSDHVAETWLGRADLRVTNQIQVDMIRLDSFVREHRIQAIDFLHIDTQGTDVAVLKSLGKEISRVRAGVVEVPQSESVMLYKNQHTRQEAIDFLTTHGFEIWKTTSQQNEDNLFFRRNSRL